MNRWRWILPEFRSRTQALSQVATSFNFNGSKWFLCGFDSAFLWVRDRRAFKHTFAASGAYLAQDVGDGVYDPEFKDWAVPLGRRFRSLRIWMVLNYFGVSGMQNHLRYSISMANKLRALLRGRADLFHLPVETELGLVVFRLVAGDAATDRAVQGLQQAGFCLFPSTFEGHKIVRVAIGGIFTDPTHIDNFWNLLVALADKSK